MAAQEGPLELRQGGVVVDADEVRGHGLAELLGEGLALALELLPVPLHAVAHDLVEVDARGLGAEDRGSGVGLDQGGLGEPELFRRLIHVLEDDGVRGQAVKRDRVVALVPERSMPSVVRAYRW